MEQNKEKRMKRNEDNLRGFWDNIKQQDSDYREPRKRRKTERICKKCLKRF